MNAEIQNTLEKGLEYAKLNADQAEIILTKGTSFSTSSFNGKTDKLAINQGNTVGVRVIKNNRVGISYSEDLAQKSIESAIDQAVSNSKFMNEEPHEKIGQGMGKVTNTHNKNQLTEQSSADEKINLSIRLEKDILALDKKVKSAPYNGVSEGLSEYYNFNSEGLQAYESSGSVSCYTSCLMEEGDKNGMHYKSSSARGLSNLDIDLVLNESYQKAKALFNAESITSGNYDVIFSPNTLSSLFSIFSIIYSGKATAENKNPLMKKMGTQIFDERFSLIDDPRFSSAMTHHEFDSEGMSQDIISLFENGIYKDVFHNSKTASELDVENNFRAARGARGTISTTSTNMIISSSETVNEEELFNGKPVVEIFSIQGAHSGADAVSGNFSFGASGHLKHNGKVTPVKGFTISGNFYEMMNNIASYGDVTHSDSGKSFFSPLIKFRSLHISGA